MTWLTSLTVSWSSVNSKPKTYQTTSACHRHVQHSTNIFASHERHEHGEPQNDAQQRRGVSSALRAIGRASSQQAANASGSRDTNAKRDGV
jgi:hypothetical protein